MALILIIDDSSFQRKRIREAVQALGHEVLDAANGAEGLEMVAAHALDCVVTDLLMPVMDGIELLEALYEQGSNVPVIVVTADVQDSTAEQCIELGAKAVINKPPAREELDNTINHVLSLNKEALT